MSVIGFQNLLILRISQDSDNGTELNNGGSSISGSVPSGSTVVFSNFPGGPGPQLYGGGGGSIAQVRVEYVLYLTHKIRKLQQW